MHVCPLQGDDKECEDRAILQRHGSLSSALLCVSALMHVKCTVSDLTVILPPVGSATLDKLLDFSRPQCPNL